MSDNIDYDNKEVAQFLSEDEIRGAHTALLNHETPSDGKVYKAMMDTIEAAGVRVEIHVVDGANPAYPAASKISSLNPNHDTAPCDPDNNSYAKFLSMNTTERAKVPKNHSFAKAFKDPADPDLYHIYISIQYLRNKLYKSGENFIPMTLERVIAHEMTHVWQDVTGQVRGTS